MKKFLTFILVLAMVMSVSSFAMAAEIPVAGGELASGSYSLSGNVVLTSPIVIPAGNTVTIDLDGYELSYTDSSGHACYMIENSGNLTIMDGSTSGNGKITFVSSTPDSSFGYSTSTVGNGGTLTVKSGTIENNTIGGASYAIDNFWYSSDVSTTIEGGKIVGKKIAVRQVLFSDTAMNTLNISGGEIKGAVQTHNYSNSGGELAKVRISGGTIDGSSMGYSYYTYYTKAHGHAGTDIEITGGDFTGYLFIYNGNTGSANKDFANLSVSGGTFNDDVYIYTMGASSSDYNYIEALAGGEYAVPPYEGMIVPNMAAANVGNGTEDAPYTIEPAKTSGTSDGPITIVPASLNFGTVKAGYAQPEAKMISVQGVVTSDKYVTVTVSAGYEVSSAKDSGYDDSVKLDVNSNAPSDFNVYVRPQANLGAGTYNGSATVQVNNSSDHPKLNDNENEVALTFVVEPNSSQTVEKPSSGGGYYGPDVWYIGGNTFGTNTNQVPTSVEIDQVPVSFTMNGSQITVDCITPGAKWVKVSWGSTTNTRYFTPDANAYCAQAVIPKTGGMSIWAAIAQFLGF